jgi:beta-1,4-mannosyl-glycoprotein beta-1,4-N-acetylglucosaminyltransferase
MYPHVDAFVLVESTRTFVGNLKPLYYQENLARFAKYTDKIIHVVVDDLYSDPKILFCLIKGEQWINEKHQRDGITLGIEYLASEKNMEKRGWKLKGDDVLLISDVDEIYDVKYLEIITSSILKINGLLIIPMDMYYYHLKIKLNNYWKFARGITYSYYLCLPMTTYPRMKVYRNISEQIRCCNSDLPILNGIFGWHLSCFGDEYMISDKLKEFSHQEYNSVEYTNPEIIKKRMENGEDLFGRELESQKLKRIEFSENTYLPPFPEGVEDVWKVFPFCLGSGTELALEETVLEDTKQRIVDCFIFYNELDMLEYRLSIMYPHVDAFVLVESTRTHKGSLKPLYYQENLTRFAKYADKIVHVVVDDLYSDPKIDYDTKKGEQWINEKHQRDGITLGIERLALDVEKRGWKLKKEDVLLISDVDEIYDVKNLKELASIIIVRTDGLMVVRMDMYYYHLKNKSNNYWSFAKVITYSYYLGLPMTTYPGMKGYRNISEKIRGYEGIIPCLHGVFGWHLSYFGDEHMISNKLKEFAHQEYNSSIYTNSKFIKERVEKGMDILGRSDVNIQRIEYADNPYLPPFPEGVDWNRFPFCLSPSSSGVSNSV